MKTLEQFLECMNDDLQNEWTHLTFYLYHSSAVTGLDAAEYREWLVKAANGELTHVQMFLDRLFGLNYAQPCQRGHDFPKLLRFDDILAYATKLESQVIDSYAQRLRQLEELDSPEAAYLKVFYEDQLQDSYEDRERIMRMLSGVLGPEHLRKYSAVPRD